MNEIEHGIAHDGIAPRLVQQFGSLHGAATDAFRPISEVLRRRLHRLDGKEFGTYMVPIQPGEPKAVDRLDPSTSVEFIQSAGTADAMTVEFKRREADGVLRQYAVGRDVEEEGARTVSWATDHSETVPASEVFTADEAHAVYLQWCWDQTIPDGYRLRLVDI